MNTILTRRGCITIDRDVMLQRCYPRIDIGVFVAAPIFSEEGLRGPVGRSDAKNSVKTESLETGGVLFKPKIKVILEVSPLSGSFHSLFTGGLKSAGIGVFERPVLLKVHLGKID